MAGISFIQDLAVAILVATVAGWLFQRVGLSVIAGYLVGGMVAGPHTGLVPAISDAANVEVLAQIGLIFLMFAIGMNLSLRRLRRIGFPIVLGTALAALLMFTGTRVAALALGASEVESLFLAGMLVVSSSAIVSRALRDRGATHRRSGQLALGITVMEDVIAILVLTSLISYTALGAAKAPPIMEALGFFGAFAIFLGVTGLLLVPRFLRLVSVRAPTELQTLLVAALLLLVAIVSHQAGYSLALGAFLLGAIVAETPQRPQLERSFEGLRHLFGTLFFVAIGMMVDLRVLFDMWAIVLAISVVAIVARATVSALSLVLIGTPPREALRAGMILTPVGEFSLVIAQVGVWSAVLTPQFFPLAVGVCAVTTLVCPFLIRSSGKAAWAYERLAPAVVKNGVAFYHRWLGRVATIRAESLFWRLTQRRLIQMGVGVLFVTGLLIVSNFVYWRLIDAVGTDWLVPNGTVIVFWTALALVVLVPLVAVWRNVSALALLYAQMTSRRREKETVAPFLIESGIKLAAGTALFIWLAGLLPLGAATLWVFLVVGGLMLVALALFRRRIVLLHSQLEVELEELIGAEPRKEVVLPQWLAGNGEWELNVNQFELPDGAVCAGHCIGELELRSRFGCSIVAIDRQGFYMANPSPQTVLYPRDRLLLLGSAEEIAAARDLLSARAERTDEATGLDEVQTETVAVPPDSAHTARTLAELNIPGATGVLVVGIKRDGRCHMNPGGGEKLQPNDELLVIGTTDQLRRFERWIKPAKPALEVE
jgi:monovalent cation:H+ antiporter-2, CPA2 family